MGSDHVVKGRQFFPWEPAVKLASPLADLQARRLMQARVSWP